MERRGILKALLALPLAPAMLKAETPDELDIDDGSHGGTSGPLTEDEPASLSAPDDPPGRSGDMVANARVWINNGEVMGLLFVEVTQAVNIDERTAFNTGYSSLEPSGVTETTTVTLRTLELEQDIEPTAEPVRLRIQYAGDDGGLMECEAVMTNATRRGSVGSLWETDVEFQAIGPVTIWPRTVA